MARTSVHPIFKLLCTNYLNHQDRTPSLVLFSSPKLWSPDSRFCCLLPELLKPCSTRNRARKALGKTHDYVLWKAWHFLEGLKTWNQDFWKNTATQEVNSCRYSRKLTADFSVGILCLGFYTFPPASLSSWLFYHFSPPSYSWLHPN